jgi:hypothetical protein
MPWSIVENEDRCPVNQPYGVVKDDDNALEGCHATMEEAEDQQAALYASESDDEERGWKEDDEEEKRTLLNKIADFFGLSHLVHKERAISIETIYYKLREMLNDGEEEYGEYAFINDIYQENGSTFAIITRGGKLYRIPIVVSDSDARFGEMQEVEAKFTPTTEQSTPPTMRQSSRVIRQANGRYRWISVSCTAVVNRVGEIDSTALFDDFVQRLNNGEAEYPIRDFFHLGPKFRIGQADFVAREGVALITSGLYDENNPLAEAEIAARQADPTAWGDSIYYDPQGEPEMWEVSRDITIPVYQTGVLKAISTLPENLAASLFTGTTLQEVNRMRGEIKDAIVKLFQGDEEKAEECIASLDVDGLNRSVADGGLIARAADQDVEDVIEEEDDEEEEPTTDEQTTDHEPVNREIVIDEELVDVISGQVMQSLQPFLDQLNTIQQSVADALVQIDQQVQRASDLDSRLQSVERTDEQKQQEWINDLPRQQTQRTTVTYRPRDAHRDSDSPPTAEQIANQTLGKLPQYSQQQ